VCQHQLRVYSAVPQTIGDQPKWAAGARELVAADPELRAVGVVSAGKGERGADRRRLQQVQVDLRLSEDRRVIVLVDDLDLR